MGAVFIRRNIIANSHTDDNFNPTLIAVSTSDGVTPINLEADPTTGALLTTMNGGTLVSEEFNSIAATYPDTSTEVYTYKLGATTVAVVTVVYQDAVTKSILTSVTRA